MKAQGQMERLNRALLMQDYRLARKLAETLIQEKPEVPELYLLLGNVYTHLGFYTQAIDAFQKALELDPENADAHNNLGIVYKSLDNYKTALSAFEKAARLAPQRGDIVYNLANLCKAQGNKDAARRNYIKSIALNPDFPMAYNNLGTLYEEEKDYAKAEECYRQGLGLDSGNSSLWYNLGNCLQSQGHLEEAKEAFVKTLEKRPDWDKALNNLGIVQLKLGEEEKAVETFKKLLVLHPGDLQGLNNLAYALAGAGALNEAEKTYKTILDQNADYFRAVLNLNRMYLQKKDPEKALEVLKPLRESHPEDPDILAAFARTLIELGRLDEAQEELSGLLQHYPDHAEGLLAKGLLESRKKNWRETEHYLLRAVENAPGNPELRIHLAHILREQGKLDEAEKETRTFLDIAPYSLPGKLELGNLLLEKKDPQKARAFFEDLKKENPNNPGIIRGLMESAEAQGDRQAAIQYAGELADLPEDGGGGNAVSNLEIGLENYERLTEEFSRELAPIWQKNLAELFARDDEGMVEVDREEEDSLLFENLKSIADEEVPILDVGGIEPVISVNEAKETVFILDEEEEIPSLDEDEEETPEIAPVMSPSREAAGPGSGPQGQGKGREDRPENAPGRAPGNGLADLLSGQSPALRIETGPIEIRKIPPAPMPMPVRPPRKQEKPSQKKPPQEKPPTPKKPEKPGENGKKKDEKEKKPAGPAPKDPKKDSLDLLAYLKTLTTYLPPQRNEEFNRSGMKKKLDQVRSEVNHLGGIEKVLELEQKEKAAREKAEKLAGTLNFIKDLADYSSDETLQKSIKGKINNILEKMKSLQ